VATYDEAMTWTKRLAKQLGQDATPLGRLDAYYTGRHPLAFASSRFQEAFGGMFSAFADNWCPLIVDSTRQRLHVTGFRFPLADAEQDPAKGDRLAWDLWQANYLDADSDVLHTDAMVFGRSYVAVGAGDVSKGEPPALMTVESPLNVIVAVSKDRRRRRLAALRVFQDDDGSNCATLMLPDETWYWTQKGTSLSFGGQWEMRAEPVPQPLGVVPVVPFLNRPRLDPWGFSELIGVIPMQDAVNKLVADMMIASEFVAMPQRWATGLEIMRDPLTNAALDPFPAISRLLQAEDPGVAFGQFAPGNLDAYVHALELLIQHVASQSATPPHYFYLSGNFPSGESIKSAEAGLVAKAIDRTRTFGESWEEVMRLAFKVIGDDQRAQALDAETIWGDVEVRTESAHVDSTLKKQAIGVPLEQLWEDLGYTPQQIERFQALRLATADIPLPKTTAPLSDAGAPQNEPGAVPASALVPAP
jgi:hypothetical protein